MNTKLIYTRGDITQLAVDAIVNSTETSLVGSLSGVDGAIRKAAGEAFSQACCKSISDSEWEGNRLSIGGVVSIPATGKLKAKYVINTFSPDIAVQKEKKDVMKKEKEDVVKKEKEEEIRQKLRECYTNSLEAAQRLNLCSIAFPCISTGCHQVGRMPSMCSLTLVDVAKVAVDAVSKACERFPKIEKVVFCCFNDECEKAYGEILGVKEAFVPYDQLLNGNACKPQ